MSRKRGFSYALLGSVENRVSTPLPLYVHALGHVTRYFPYQEDLPPRKEPFVEVYWCISGAGRFFLEEGEEQIMRAGDVFYRLENERHYHEIVEEPWEYRWLTFAGPLAEPLLKSYQYPHKCFHAGPCPRELYMRLETLMREKTDYNYRESVAVICSILARFGGSGDTTSPEAGLTGRAKDVCSIRTYIIDTLNPVCIVVVLLHTELQTEGIA